MSGICQILADSLSLSRLSLSVCSFELVYNTVQTNTSGVKRATVPSRVPISAILDANTSTYQQQHVQCQFVGCNNGGRGGNLLNVNVSSNLDRSTETGPETVILRVFLFFAVTVWDFRNAEPLSKDINYPWNNECIFAPTHGLLEYTRKFGFRPTLGR